MALHSSHLMNDTITRLTALFKTESAGGVLLVCAAVLAMICANSPLAGYYFAALETHLTIQIGGAGLDKPLHHWINDGLMAIFFLVVGLEIKREVFGGELASWRQASLPFFAALGGVALPAVIYYMLNEQNTQALSGWAVPCATDIAFALGILALFGSRVPLSLKVFLTAVAVIDDLIAIVIIAIFYTANLSGLPMLVGSLCLAVLLTMNLLGVTRLSAYMLVGLVMWFAVLKSGVHATLAGVALGLIIPHRQAAGRHHSMLEELEHGLHPWVAFGILPLFAFANAGLRLDGLTWQSLLEPIPLGIAAGLFLGKQFGVFALSCGAVALGIANKPSHSSWLQFYAICILCGVGFTMSLFIGSLAFSSAELVSQVQLGVMAGSLVSALFACVLLWRVLPRGASAQKAAL